MGYKQKLKQPCGGGGDLRGCPDPPGPAYRKHDTDSSVFLLPSRNLIHTLHTRHIPATTYTAEHFP